ncbi:YkgJ family cysteine cluster protein [Chitinibacter sp. FCG-7]|uniref:YkgJ family cysteine cluster protein n=1 Tax=Chitinibacter mangrovi TaxID=3153927 RepID=A0AAU7FDK2_9NEIS
MSHVCMSCGACCASFRVSFYFGESDAVPGGTVPNALVEPVTPFLVAMRGTNQPQPHCTALQGRVGEAASCGIYELRASTCREVDVGDERCNTARARYGLPAIDEHGVPTPDACA